MTVKTRLLATLFTAALAMSNLIVSMSAYAAPAPLTSPTVKSFATSQRS